LPWPRLFLITVPHITDEFKRYKIKCERSEPCFTSDTFENYNTPFTLKELKDAFHKAHNTTTGPDDVHYEMLKHLPDESLLALLNIFDKIWITGQFLCTWSEATVIPITKPR
jgi:hypothetical protein